MPIPRTWLWMTLPLLAAAPASADAPPRFGTDVLPVLRARCLDCHGEAKRKGGLSLQTRAALIEGGDTGPAVVPGHPDESLLIEQVASGAMPPGKAPKLTPDEVATLRAWVAAGAVVDETPAASGESAAGEGPVHWAFVPPRAPAVPATTGRAAHPIDAFLLDRLGAAGLGFSPEAERPALIRRLAYDLTGLPPTPDEIDAFASDARPDAYERLVDRLLASPRYGERWGRHWLDLAGYADSEGILAADHVRSAAWRYRDWVVRAFNADRPYDAFLRDQIAGDEVAGYWEAYRTRRDLPPDVVDALVATGYLRCAGDTSRPDFVNIKNAPGYYYQTLDDTVKIVASSVMGLTLQCARCHTHKYDPVTQAEYYQVQAVFMSGYRPAQWVPQVERRRLLATAAEEAEVNAHNAAIDGRAARRKASRDAIVADFTRRLFDERLSAIPAAIRGDVRAAFEADPNKLTEIQKYLFERFQAELKPPPARISGLLDQRSPRDRDLIRGLDAADAADQARRQTLPEIRAFYDLPGAPRTPVLQRGDYLRPGREVGPGVPRAIATPEPFRWSPPASDAPTSGRRRAFADWLTQPGHPLTARVMVNRIWLHHFGEGLVATPDNFGLKGEPPSHPELLDWLATEFVRRGWSIKAVHRLILTSAAYRQSSRNDPAAGAPGRAADPDNRLLWRQRLRRLEAEALRDAVLAVSGALNPAAGGPPVPMVSRPEGEVDVPEGPAGRQRSVYLQVRRSQPLTFLQVFDQPVMETNCTRRPVSTVSSQALNLLNSDFLARQAALFAGRVLGEAPDASAVRAVRLAFGRPPTDRERVALADYLSGQAARGRTPAEALADVCQMLLSSNEFAYVE